MPRLKFDYVVSFSSEDPDHRAANLLAAEVSKKKWLCSKGEPSCSVVLQLPRAVEISAVHIGAYHAALVEVLVGLSERPSDPFQVLVPSCVFVPPAQSRRDEGVARVRSFTGEELAADARGKRYDRVRVVCSQPYNKHCQYGLSFVHIHEPESRNDPPSATQAPAAVPSRMFALDTFSSDDEDFRPGELFAQHLKSPNNSDSPGNSSTSAQIRQANSQALKNISDSATKILKTPISKTSTSQRKQTEEEPTNRQRQNIMYTDDDDRPNDKIDHVVNRHKEEKTKNEELNKTKMADKNEKRKTLETPDNLKRNSDSTNNKASKNLSIANANKKKQSDNNFNSRPRNVTEQQSAKKRKRDDDKTDKDPSMVIGEVCDDLSEVLRGVTLALSGYAGAQRAALRDTALVLGARYNPDWSPQCTHLICAFPNTPKLRTARASGAHVGVATAEWLDKCLAHRRRLPWRWFATVAKERAIAQPLPLPQDLEREQQRERAPSEGDTDDEIEKALETAKQNIRMSTTPSPDAAPAVPEGAAMPDSDVMFVRDERFIGHMSLMDSDDDSLTDCEEYTSTEERIDPKKALPDFFEGFTFVITDEVAKSDRDLLARYVQAFGGLVIQGADLDEENQVDYVVCSEGSAQGKQYRGKCVRPSWVWQCARERHMCTHDTQ